MPQPLTPKQERFVQSYQQTGNASEAYRTAYRTERMKASTVQRNAHALVSEHSKIRARLEADRERARLESGVTVDAIASMLREDRELARELGQAAPAVAAAVHLAKLMGLYSDKSEVTTHVDTPADRAPDMDAIRKSLKALGE